MSGMGQSLANSMSFAGRGVGEAGEGVGGTAGSYSHHFSQQQAGPSSYPYPHGQGQGTGYGYGTGHSQGMRKSPDPLSSPTRGAAATAAAAYGAVYSKNSKNSNYSYNVPSSSKIGIRADSNRMAATVTASGYVGDDPLHCVSEGRPPSSPPSDIDIHGNLSRREAHSSSVYEQYPEASPSQGSAHPHIMGELPAVLKVRTSLFLTASDNFVFA